MVSGLEDLKKYDPSARKGKRKAAASDMDGDNDAYASAATKKKKNKQRVLLLSSRGITHRMRHLMNDLETLLPHVKKDSKLDSKNHLHLLPELADLHSCNNTLYFEARRHEDLYLWAAKTPNGPSIKLHVQNVHTMDELKMTGNCLKGSRGLLSFDAAFEETEWGRLTKELFTHIFGVPPQARRAKPFIDHILTFSILDSKIWFRNFQVRHDLIFALNELTLEPWTLIVGQIVEKDPLQPNGPPEMSLIEIGPRFVLTPIRIFEGAFGGATVFANPEFVSPAQVRSIRRKARGDRYKERKLAQQERSSRQIERKREEDPLAVAKVFA
ncbi:ribosome biogenesis protein BRX1 [Lactarius hengduanensis]|nr:ribosome biogenesis protein BRX1 [Lactarius hengduanensis]